jgi:ubiquinone/menaquinone biosynthesis C-methylase UbiE
MQRYVSMLVSMKQQKKQKTSWGKEAEWYSDHLTQEDTYHAKVLLPNILRILDPKKGRHILEIGCGEGFFARALAEKGAQVTACDVSKELITLGKEKGGNITYQVSPAQDLSWFKAHSADHVLAVLTIQNMHEIQSVFNAVRVALEEQGTFVMILNHPVLRTPKISSWAFDPETNVQYRRLDGYLSAKKMSIDMHPGKKATSVTYSFHRPLQEYMKLLHNAGFCITRLEEWISHKTSEPGPKAKAENTARKEFPLFMMIETKVLPTRVQ